VVGEAPVRVPVSVDDETGPGADAIGSRFQGLFGTMAAAAAAVGAALLDAINEAVDAAEGALQRLIQQQGSVEDRPLLATLVGGGVAEEDALAAIQALRGPGRDLGLGGPAAAGQLAGVAAVGASPTSALQAAQGFGLQGESALNQVALTIATAQTTGQDPSELIEAVREYGPVLGELGLSYLESVQFIADLQRSGVSISRVSPALNQFIRRASAQGVDARDAAQAAFDAVRQAEPEQANAIAQGLFGAEGGLRLARGIRTGQIGLGEELAIDDEVLDQASLLALNAPTSAERYERSLDALGLSDSFLEQVGGVVGRPVTAIPGASSLAGQFIEGAGEGQTLADQPNLTALLEAYNARLDALIDVNRAQLDATLLNPQEPDFAERIIESVNSDAGRLTGDR